MQILSIYLGFILGLFATVQAAPFGRWPGFEKKAQGHREKFYVTFDWRPFYPSVSVPQEVARRLASNIHEQDKGFRINDPEHQIEYLPNMWPPGLSPRAAIDFSWGTTPNSVYSSGHLTELPE
ncbi:hypothetical protein DFH05DRAFT_1462935 [Lentinula detonsa]|uniref:Uncharacterized protein n=1 Tax=Lentinula detonsa TaxID=2804962 RepID=A0A9W8NT79_9AGAR|nr:hypothetical protein DFH05DRAFT_1462935 [Lentinula detonsa]KAJ3983319.1 hypothetical protein F5890DRAFT_1523779 [Lentinula detonsa]